MERRLAAILAADVVGYSRLMGEDEARTLNDVRRHLAELIEPKVAEHDGRIVKLMGDGLLAEFPSALKALLCAVQIQQLMASRNVDVPADCQVVYRMGINIGDVMVEDGDIFGEGVNVAARLESLANPGGICISRALRDQVRDKLDLGLDDLGEINVKNIARAVRVFRVIIDERAETFLTPVATPQPLSPPRRRFRAPAVALVVAVVGLGAWFMTPTLNLTGKAQLPGLDDISLSVAVLPFKNLSGDADQDYFADALTEDITSDLSRISGSFVIARSTAATYRNQQIDARQVARDLNVRYLLEGTVRRTSQDVQVGVSLIDGTSGQQIWSERYEKSAGDMYAFQNEVTGRVARSLNLELKDALSRQAGRKQAGNLDADDLALRAWAELWTKPQSNTTNAAALKHVQRALELDPDNAEALGVAAYAYARAGLYGWGYSRADALEKGIAAGDKSLSLDPKNADTVYSLALVHYLKDDNHRALELLQQCMEINRNHAPAYFLYGTTLMRLDRADETIGWIRRAFTLSPRDPLRSVWYSIMGRASVLLGQDAEAVELARKGIATNKKHPHNYAVLASALAHLDRLDDAKPALAELLQIQPELTAGAYWTRVAGNDPNSRKAFKRLVDGLRKAGLQE